MFISKVFLIEFSELSKSFFPDTTPALLMRISTGPKVSTATFAASLIAVDSLTSHCMAILLKFSRVSSFSMNF